MTEDPDFPHAAKGSHRAAFELSRGAKRSERSATWHVSTAAALLLLTGCAWQVGPDYAPPETVVADEWHQALAADLSSGQATHETWWTAFNDATLDALMAEAASTSLDVRLADARIAEARALLGVASGSRVPDLDATGAAQRQRTSEGISAGTPPPQTRPDTIRQVGVEATWEVDLWGRVRRSIESASASYEAAVEDARDVSVVLFAEIGSNYMQLRTLQQRLALANANVALQRETLELVQARHRAELAPDLEVRQAELNLASTESFIPSLQAAIAQTLHRLSVLTGQAPDALYDRLLPTAPLPALPSQLSVGIPADLVRRRPDLRRAERVLAAQTARIGVARSALYPNFFLGGDFSYGTAAGSLFNSGNEGFSIGPFFSWNLFDGGRVRQSIKVEEARTEQALIAYELTVLRALQDVEDSLVGFTEERRRAAALERAVTAATEADRLVRELYKRGLTNFQNVLDTQRALFGQQDLLAEAQGNVHLQLISIYRALGGGWSPTTP